MSCPKCGNELIHSIPAIDEGLRFSMLHCYICGTLFDGTWFVNHANSKSLSPWRSRSSASIARRFRAGGRFVTAARDPFGLWEDGSEE